MPSNHNAPLASRKLATGICIGLLIFALALVVAGVAAKCFGIDGALSLQAYFIAASLIAVSLKCLLGRWPK